MRHVLLATSVLAVLTLPSSGALCDGACSGVGYDSGLRAGDEIGYGCDAVVCATVGQARPGTCSGVAVSPGVYVDAGLLGAGTVACAGRYHGGESTNAAIDACDPSFQGAGYSWSYQTQGVALPHLASAGHSRSCSYQGGGSGTTASWSSFRAQGWGTVGVEWYEYSYEMRYPGGSQHYEGRGISVAGAGWSHYRDPYGTHCLVGLDTPCPLGVGAPPGPVTPPMLP